LRTSTEIVVVRGVDEIGAVSGHTAGPGASGAGIGRMARPRLLPVLAQAEAAVEAMVQPVAVVRPALAQTALAAVQLMVDRLLRTGPSSDTIGRRRRHQVPARLDHTVPTRWPVRPRSAGWAPMAIAAAAAARIAFLTVITLLTCHNHDTANADRTELRTL